MFYNVLQLLTIRVFNVIETKNRVGLYFRVKHESILVEKHEALVRGFLWRLRCWVAFKDAIGYQTVMMMK